MNVLKDRVALVTGGSAGVGLACAQAFADEGATVIIAARNIDNAERAANGVRATGGKATAYKVDVSSVAELRSMFDFIGKTYGKLNVLFNHAGVQGPIGLDITEEQFDQTVNTNLKSQFFATTFALPLLRACAPQASIIYTSSTAGARAGKLSPLYGTCKAGTIMLTRSVALMLGPEHIRANAIILGPAETAFSRGYATMAGLDDTKFKAVTAQIDKTIPLGHIAQPEDVAGTVLFLASDQSAYITGTAIPVDGGLLA